MAQNHILLETIELTQTAASVTFDNIPQTGYTDLKIVVSARTSDANTGTIAYVKFNGSSSTYSTRYLQGRGDGTLSGTGSTSYGEIGRFPGVNSPVTDNMFSNTEITIPNYLSSDNKSYSVDGVTEAKQTIAYAVLTAGSWATPNPITSILIASTAGNLLANSTFSIYGIASVNTTPEIAPLASGGNIVANDGTYWYHAFLSSGTFTPTKALTCDCLVIAGGGGGSSDGNGSAGGGGAGGLVYTSSASFNLSNYSVTVGAGGIGSAYNGGGGNGTVGGSGTNSNITGSALSLTAAVGGGGGGNSRTGGAATSGGSGGGGNCQTNTTGGAGTSGQGFAGGNSAIPSGGYYPSAGGGGAGAVGGAGVANLTGAGAGGAGLSIYSSWGLATLTGQNVSGTYWYAGGGGGAMYNQSNENGTGGAGGNGGGGTGGYTKNAPALSAGTNGITNTGSGGGGSANYTGQSSNNGGSGGSGIVIIRYPIN